MKQITENQARGGLGGIANPEVNEEIAASLNGTALMNPAMASRFRLAAAEAHPGGIAFSPPTLREEKTPVDLSQARPGELRSEDPQIVEGVEVDAVGPGQAEALPRRPAPVGLSRAIRGL